jgi:hypothetical protein
MVRLAEKMFLLYFFVPSGTNVFIVPWCALRPKMLETCDPSGVGLFIAILCLAEQMFLLCHLCALRNKCFHCAMVRLAA